MSDTQDARPFSVVVHSTPLLVLSFLMSANSNVLPQLFFQRHAPAQGKLLLLALCLLGCTCASILGVAASRWARPGRLGVFILLAMTLAAENALFLVQGTALYMVLAAAAQVGANHLMNHLDHAGVQRAGASQRRIHDGATTISRLLGMLAAPIMFPWMYDQPALLHGTLGLGTLLAVAGTAALFSKVLPSSLEQVAGTKAAPARREDVLLLGFSLTVYVALYLFAANLIYLLRDAVHVQDAEQRGGTTLTIVFAGALAGNLLASLGKRPAGHHLRLPLFLAPVPLLAGAALVLFLGEMPPTEVFLAGACALGASYGAFLAELRAYVSNAAREPGREGLLTWFNNLANVSSLVAFLVMALIAGWAQGGAHAAHPWVLGLVGLLPVTGLVLLFPRAAARRGT